MFASSIRKQLWSVNIISIGFFSILCSMEYFIVFDTRELQLNRAILSSSSPFNTTSSSSKNNPQAQYSYRRTNHIDYYHETTNERYFSGSDTATDTDRLQKEHNNIFFPRWDGAITIDALNKAIDVAMSGIVRFDRVHRVYIISLTEEETKNTSTIKMHQATVPRSPLADQEPYRRAKTMESFALQVLDFVRKERRRQQQSNNHISLYPYLNTILDQGGFAYIANYADSKFCSDINPFIDEDENPLLPSSTSLVPIFTLSAPINCQFSFPVPTYETIESATLPYKEQRWENITSYYRTVLYPRSKQHRKAIWRGAPTGNRSPYCNQRVQLCLYAMNRSDILDVKLVRKRREWDTSNSDCNVTQATNFNETIHMGNKITPMEDFQKYRAIIDVDGHSWSSRFGRLICYNSVILKVEPTYVDYFYPILQPWVHYIPIHANLSNLYDMVFFAISDDDDDARVIQQIIDNANEWCTRNMNHDALVRNMAHIWNKYAYFLLLSYSTMNYLSYRSDWQSVRESLYSNYDFMEIHR